MLTSHSPLTPSHGLVCLVPASSGWELTIHSANTLSGVTLPSFPPHQSVIHFLSATNYQTGYIPINQPTLGILMQPTPSTPVHQPQHPVPRYLQAWDTLYHKPRPRPGTSWYLNSNTLTGYTRSDQIGYTFNCSFLVTPLLVTLIGYTLRSLTPKTITGTNINTLGAKIVTRGIPVLIIIVCR